MHPCLARRPDGARAPGHPGRRSGSSARHCVLGAGRLCVRPGFNCLGAHASGNHQAAKLGASLLANVCLAGSGVHPAAPDIV
eukprot:10021171-Alexandrium_andersonii.AAC.1